MTSNFIWRGIVLGPEPLKHEKLTGRGGWPGISVLRCVVCTRFDPHVRIMEQLDPHVRIMEQLVRPGWVEEQWRDDRGRLVFAERVPPIVAGWITSCGHVVWAGDWELVYPGSLHLPRWEDRAIRADIRERARRAAFSIGEEEWPYA